MWKALVKLVEKWAYTCEHDWELIDKTSLYHCPDDKLPYGRKFTYMCKKCCEFRVKQV